MAFEPEDEWTARRDVRAVEIVRVLVLLGIAAIGVRLVLGGLGGSDVLVTLVALCAAGTLVLAVRRVVQLRRKGL